jgi:hypothetical protein
VDIDEKDEGVKKDERDEGWQVKKNKRKSRLPSKWKWRR